jgi:tetratricopeptide (TPR) repeat protein
MMSLQSIDPREFVELVEPLLAKKDLCGLLCLLKSRWSPEQIRALLRTAPSDARKVALLSLALVGPTCCAEELAFHLRDPDPMINQLAEHALWAIWFRAGKTEKANQCICKGAQALDEKDYPGAIDQFNHAIREDPDFAEAYNQRAIAYYLLEDYEKSIADCHRTIKRMPCHFGALCGLGHCHAHLNQIPQSIEYYEKALERNPHIECVREAVDELRKRL